MENINPNPNEISNIYSTYNENEPFTYSEQEATKDEIKAQKIINRIQKLQKRYNSLVDETEKKKLEKEKKKLEEEKKKLEEEKKKLEEEKKKLEEEGEKLYNDLNNLYSNIPSSSSSKSRINNEIKNKKIDPKILDFMLYLKQFVKRNPLAVKTNQLAKYTRKNGGNKKNNSVNIESVKDLEEFFQKPNSHAFVLFHADYCPWCQKVLPVWKQIVEHYNHESKPNIRIFMIERKEIEKYPNKFHPDGFPTFSYYHNGKHTEDYPRTGERTLEAFQQWIDSKKTNVHGGKRRAKTHKKKKRITRRKR